MSLFLPPLRRARGADLRGATAAVEASPGAEVAPGAGSGGQRRHRGTRWDVCASQTLFHGGNAVSPNPQGAKDRLLRRKFASVHNPSGDTTPDLAPL